MVLPLQRSTALIIDDPLDLHGCHELQESLMSAPHIFNKIVSTIFMGTGLTMLAVLVLMTFTLFGLIFYYG